MCFALCIPASCSSHLQATVASLQQALDAKTAELEAMQQKLEAAASESESMQQKLQAQVSLKG